MKNKVLFVVLLLSSILTGTVFAQTDSIYTEVYSDTAIIWHTNTERNCGSLYDMEVSLNDNLFIITEVDTGWTEYCECVFDLSVSLTELEPGTYDVDVYSDELYTDNTTYWGSTSFVIENTRDNSSRDWSIGEEYQSPCGGDVFGCTDSIAINYDSSATYDDGSCIYPDECFGNSDCSDGWVCIPPNEDCNFESGEPGYCLEIDDYQCTSEYFPVCGCDGESYGNPCEANYWGFTGIDYLGLCEENANVWHITTTGSDSTGDGSAENPFATIQFGIDFAEEGDSVLVTSGTYYENIIWPSTNGIQLIGEDRETTIIDGNQQASVIRFEGDLYGIIDTTTLISDFTITNGSASTGGGMYCYNSSPSLENVTISGNSASYSGGGIYCGYSPSLSFSSENRCNIYSNNVQSGGSGADIYSNSTITVIVDTFTVMTPTDYYASPLDNFTFDILNAVNTQVDADLYVSPDGDNSNDGLTAETPLKTIQYATNIILVDSLNPHTIHLANGIYSPSTNGEYFPVEVINYVSLVGESEDNVILDAEGVASVMRCRYVTSSTISHLTLTNGSTSYAGGGIYCSSSSPSLVDVSITNNSAYMGGGIHCRNNSSPSLENVTITGNSATGTDWPSGGGGIFCASSSPSLVNVTITENSASDDGGGISCWSSSPSLENVTISNNSASFSGGGIYCYYYSCPSLVNCILWNDTPQEVYVSLGCSVNIFYSDIQGGWTGDGNIDLDPLFTDTENGDYTLQENSPCIDTGTAFFVWESDTLVNMTEEEYNGTAPDMGAFESQYTVGIDPFSIIPLTFSLRPAYPNPFNPSTTISYAVETNGRLSLQIYDIAGRLVETLVDGITEPGTYTVKWDASGYSSGVYFVQMVAGKFVETQKVLLMK